MTGTNGEKIENERAVKINVREMTLIGLMAAVICILSPWSVYIPISAVPITLGSLAVYFTAYILGQKKGTVCVLIYLLLGAVGLPVFSGASGGLGKLLGPTGGYLTGYLFITLIAGFFIEKFPSRKAFHLLGLVLGTLVCYLIGTIWMGYLLSLGPAAALMAGVIPYIPVDALKVIVSLLLGDEIRRRLIRADLI